MNRNVESHFATLPSIDIQRSQFDRSSSHKTSFNFGRAIPIFLDEVLPGDTFQLKTNVVARMQTLLTPVMDAAYLDTYFFYVPNRLVWVHWKEFCGENTQSAWIAPTEYTIPQVKVSAAGRGFDPGTIADYFGIPVGEDHRDFSFSALPFRAYCLIMDQFFRDQNIDDPILIPFDDADVNGSNQDLVNQLHRGGKPYKVAKFHDYFTSCLPAPLKHSPVAAPLTLPSVPVIAGDIFTDNSWLYNDAAFVPRGKTVADYGYLVAQSYPSSGSNVNAQFGTSESNPRLSPANLWTLSSGINENVEYNGSIDINTLRLAFQLQKFYERCARGGTRYSEFVKAQFGTDLPDARVQRPEYLGGSRIPLSVHEVVNNSENTAEDSYLGNLGAMSVTVDQSESFTKSFSEHGMIIGIAVARYDHSYSQGLDKMWTRKRLTDFYLPVFANIGEQPVYDYELYLTGENFASKSVFGYQEAWAEYRYKPNRISGEMRPGVSNSLASWHFGDYYASTPTLSSSWLKEDLAPVDRALAVTSSVSNQIFADFYFDMTCTRPMPVYSIPGLIDHN